MHSDGSTRDYDFREKNRWRVRLWDEILRRVGKRKKTELILYLAGPEDFDREVAISKGVPSCNLIAIDRKMATVRSIRDAGNAAICGDVIDVLTTWPKGSPVCAIVLDFCQGFQRLEDLKRLAALTVAHPALKTAVLSVNMQRGRDAESNYMRELIGTFMSRHMTEFDPKHRGMLFALWYILWNVSCCVALRELMQSEHAAKVWGVQLDMFKPKAYTYRSGGLCLDSVVITSAGEVFDEDPQHATDTASFIGEGVRSIALSTAATLAVRTRRLRKGM